MHSTAVIFSLALATAAADAGSLRGTIRSSVDLVPIPAANVTVHVLLPDSVPFPTVTGPDGTYEITGIIPDNELYVVIAGKVGFRPSYTRVADLGSQDLVFDIALEPDSIVSPPPGGGGDSGTVAGTVYEVIEEGGLRGLPDAGVTIFAGGGATIASTGPEGRYSVRVPAGPFGVAVSGTGFDSMSISGLSVDSTGRTVNAVVRKAVTGVPPDPGTVPLAFALDQNFPNPFNPTTTLRYALPEAGRVRIAVFNLLGQEVAVPVDGVEKAGYGQTVFNASLLPAGVYICRLTAGNHAVTIRMVLLR